jgi:hypothetical protein
MRRRKREQWLDEKKKREQWLDEKKKERAVVGGEEES